MTLFEDALRFAQEAHAGMSRKGEGLPFILHPMEAAVICASMSSDQELLAAALLHDTVEDTDVTLEQIEARFGPRVALLVASETEEKHPELPPEESWSTRKQSSLERLRHPADPAVKLLWIGDKLANIRSFRRDWRRRGNQVWQALHQKDPGRQAWYYRSILSLTEELRDTEAWQELRDAVNEIFEGVPSA